MDATTGWLFLTRWGNSMLLLPTAACIAASLWTGRDRSMAWRWTWCFGGAVLLVLATKVAFFERGLGSRALDFTGISGHSTLAAAVLPVLAWWLAQRQAPNVQRGAIVFAWGLAVAVGISRVTLATHSISEVVIGLALGTLVAWAVIPRRLVAGRGTVVRWVLLGALLSAGSLSHVGKSEEAHGLIVSVALQLSGRSEPFTRADLSGQPAS